MPRRRVLTDEQLEELLALPVTEALLVQHWTLSPADLTVVERRRGDPNQLGFALQLCAFRYPGRLLWSDEAIPALALRLVADQLGVAPGALTAYGTRPQTRREQLDALRAAFGFAMFAPEHQRELLTWLLPAALGTADTMAVAEALMGELRRRKILAPGPSVIERLVAVAWMLAERQIARQLTGDLLPAQATALEGLLTIKGGTAMSALAWARQPPGVPGHRALARLIEQRAILQAIALDPAGAEGVHPERLRKLAREGARFTAQHLRTLSPLRRRAILIATVLDTITRLTDDTVALFDRAVGRMFRRAETRERNALLRDTRAINDKVRLLARLGTALIEARENGADLQEAVASAIGWDKLARSVAEAERLARRTKPISRPWPRGPGRCCIGSGRCSSGPCAFTPYRPPPRPSARSSFCARFTKTAARNGRPACRRAFSVRLGAKRLWTLKRPIDGAVSGRRLPCWRYATDWAPATSGSRAAANGAPSRTS